MCENTQVQSQQKVVLTIHRLRLESFRNGFRFSVEQHNRLCPADEDTTLHLDCRTDTCKFANFSWDCKRQWQHPRRPIGDLGETPGEDPLCSGRAFGTREKEVCTLIGKWSEWSDAISLIGLSRCLTPSGGLSNTDSQFSFENRIFLFTVLHST